jgi:nucleoside-diphosphate-sugar epimerase
MNDVVAVTGGTGFIGGRVVARLRREGWRVRALARRSNPSLADAGAEVVHGNLEDQSSLRALVKSARAVIHCAGAISACGRNEFVRVNRDGTAHLAAAILAQPEPPRLLLMSSLAAREPSLSSYAASKRMAEEAVHQTLSGKADFCLVRPPAVYGPGDRSTLPIFRQMYKGLLFVPAANARFSLLYVEDLAEIVAQLLQRPRWDGLVIEPDDGSGGYRWGDLARIAGGHLDRRVRTVPVPRLAMWLPAVLAQLQGFAMRRAPKLSLGKLRELYHSDWVCRCTGAALLPAGLQRVTFDNGFAATLAWYMQRKWL